MIAFIKKWPLLVGVLFAFTTFILTIVATTGSTSNYWPINNVYLGEADISRINVTKVIPEMAPVLSVLAGLVNSPLQNTSVNGMRDVFDALKVVSESSALKPLLQLLATSSNVSQTVSALALTAPMIAQLSNSSSETSDQLALLGALIQNSSNVTETLHGLATVVQTSNDTERSVARTVLGVLNQSNNATSSIDSLVVLQNQSTSEKAMLSSVLELLQESQNVTVTMAALDTLMLTNMTSNMAATLLGALQSSNSDPQTILNQILDSVSEQSRPAISAVGALLNDSRDATQTSSTLGMLLQGNISSSPSARHSLAALSVLIRHSSNQTNVISSLASLANSTNAANTLQLFGLQEILDYSINASVSVNGLQHMQSSNSLSSANDLAPIYGLLVNSKNHTATIESFWDLTEAMQSNGTALQPLLEVVSQTSLGSTAITKKTLDAMMPMVMDNLRVSSQYRLAIFTLCRGFSNGKINECSSPHTVQSFVLRDILYDELEKSDFKPYMLALGVKKQEMYLDGKLQDKHTSYVSAVRATLALNILTIVLSFVLLLLMLCLLCMTAQRERAAFCILTGAKILALFVFVFALLSGAIVAAIVNIIKQDTKADDYSVTFTTGSAYAGLIWAAFALAFITFILLFFVRVTSGKNSLININDMGSAESTASSDEKKKNKCSGGQ
ncbi:LADA_0H12904g1_1 [Lachancea dasiensis]|uniref:LADA_0H12904g1_1 n=1 Tax=Lachancea dasiensis TaxID=1072105 RepID=A0A1G4K3X6_9SACH|nr:LADA_0H12904g1_1 [Lachancea dasiensis]